MRFVNIAIAETTFKYHGVIYTIDDLFRFYFLGDDNKWHPIDANRVPEEVVEGYRDLL